MKRIYILSVILSTVILGLQCVTEEMQQVRKMQIKDVNLSKISDGVYKGDFSYGSFTYMVKTHVRNHRIVAIDIVKNRNTRHTKIAEGVVPRVIAAQTPKVDVVSGATTTSKALLKAIENSLMKR